MSFNQTHASVLPAHRLNHEAIAKTLKKIVPANVEDKTTADELRTQLNQLRESRQFHAGKAERWEAELREVEGKLASKREALKTAQLLRSKRPSLRHEIAALEADVEKLSGEALALRTAVTRETNIRDAQIKLLKAFPMSKLKQLEEDEAALEGSGRKPFPARLPSE